MVMDYFRENRRRSQQRKRIAGDEVSAIADLQDEVQQLGRSTRHIADTADSNWQEREEEHASLAATVAVLAQRVDMLEHEVYRLRVEVEELSESD